ncbi:hypothetical protein CMI42_01505 [Candidatus Pacearchaeota archaeon]|jgi:hypothetical protein|nr:hypothetical protein [Candidatus Pacearchaeota archaeon]
MNDRLTYKKTNILVNDMVRAIMKWKQPSGQAEKHFYDKNEVLEYNSIVAIVEGIFRKYKILNFIQNKIE